MTTRHIPPKRRRCAYCREWTTATIPSAYGPICDTCAQDMPSELLDREAFTLATTVYQEAQRAGASHDDALDAVHGAGLPTEHITCQHGDIAPWCSLCRTARHPQHA